MRILIVDDEEYMRDDLREALERVTSGDNKYYFAGEYDSAMKLVEERPFDVAFLDIQMPGKNGLTLAESIKRHNPKINIVMLTAYSEYALEAFKLYVSGYLLKPVMDEDLREVFDNLRTPIDIEKKKLDVQCFGNFEVFLDSKPLSFKRKKEKELLAYLICLKGASATRGEICANVFEDSVDEDKSVTYFRKISSALNKDLQRYGFENLIIHSNNSYSIDIKQLNCDYYDYLTGTSDSSRGYKGEFMNQYSWAEEYIYSLENY